jgi:hypothetical protein
MSHVNSLPSERAAVVGVIDPDAYAAGTYTTGYIPLKNFRRFMAVITAGDFVATGVLNAKLIAYTDGAGTGAADITGAAITALTQAGTDDNKQAVINLNTDALAGSAYTHFRLSMTLTTAGADAGAVVLGFDPLYGPGSDSDATTVDEIVSA